jgi:hypothetical protein
MEDPFTGKALLSNRRVVQIQSSAPAGWHWSARTTTQQKSFHSAEKSINSDHEIMENGII